MLHRPTCLVNLYHASSLKHIAGRHVSPLRYIILIAGQPVFASLTPQYRLISGKAGQTNCIDLGLT